MRGRLFDAPRRLREYYYTTRDESTPRPSRLHRARASVASSERLGDRVRIGRRHGFRAPEGLADGGDHHGQRDACRGGKRRLRVSRGKHDDETREAREARSESTVASAGLRDAGSRRDTRCVRAEMAGRSAGGRARPGTNARATRSGEARALTEPRMGNVSATRGRRAGAYRERR